jgi:VWFA-related protein
MASRWLDGLFLLCLAGVAAPAQTTPDQPGYTLHANARVVLTDVTVTDANGNPVHGLDRSAFQIFDNNREQAIASFEEHSEIAAADAPAAAQGANSFSNDFMLHPPPVFQVMVLDTSTINVIDQMYLNEELEHLVKVLPAGVPLAIYVHAGEFTILLQNFTTDKALMLTAIHKAVPHLRQPGSYAISDQDALRQIAIYLDQLPGRKNVLWFTGGSNLFLRPDATNVPPTANLRSLYDALEKGRIAIYPIDVRGPVMGSGPAQQHILMEDQAEATGGRAYFNGNGLAETAAKVVDTDGSFYSLSYTPRDFRKLDNKWHKIQVKVNGGRYTLSYRRGYYDDGLNDPEPAPRTRTVLKAGGEKVQLPENQNQAIIFRAEVLPGAVGTVEPVDAVSRDAASKAASAPKRGQAAYTIHYSVPAADFTSTRIDGGWKVEIGAGVLIFNSFGRAVGRVADTVTLTFKGDKWQEAAGRNLSFDQQINLPKGDDYLYVVVWDPTTRRFGSIQVPVEGKR